MITWILYLYIESDHFITHPYHFTEKTNCDKVGKEYVSKLKYEKYICFKDVIE